MGIGGAVWLSSKGFNSLIFNKGLGKKYTVPVQWANCLLIVSIPWAIGEWPAYSSKRV